MRTGEVVFVFVVGLAFVGACGGARATQTPVASDADAGVGVGADASAGAGAGAGAGADASAGADAGAGASVGAGVGSTEGADAGSAKGYPCLARQARYDTSRCKDVPGKPRAFGWDPHACAVTPQSLERTSKVCVAPGPHLSFNSADWCCP